jgi:hypothetical protein
VPRLKVCLVALFAAWSATASAATYYVDQTAGSDRNAGTSPTAAWKNSPGMSSFGGSGTLRPGDVVYFDRGDTWIVTGTQGLYLVGGVTYIGDVWGTGSRAVLKAGADLDAGVIRFGDHPTVATIVRGFEVNANGKVTSGIDINHRFYASPLTGAPKRVQNCDVHHVSSRASLGQYKYGIIVSDYGGSAGAVENVEILDSVVHDISRDGICLYPGDESADCRIKNITVRGSEVYNTGQDPDYCCGAGVVIKGNVQGAYVEYNYAHDVKGASVFVNSNETNHFPGVGATNINIRYNILTNATSNGAIHIYSGPSGGDAQDIKVYGNIVYNSTKGGGLIVATDSKNTLSLLVYNNTFFNAPVRVNRTGATINPFEFKNNIVYYVGGLPLLDVDGHITAHSNNIYFNRGGTLVTSRGADYGGGNLSVYEPSASSRNPLFTNTLDLPTGFSGTYGVSLTPNTDGLRVRPTSSAVDRGVILPLPYAGSVGSVTRPSAGSWDIGAYELGGRASASPLPPPERRP